jgi:ketosteroid isomerase-like protein
MTDAADLLAVEERYRQALIGDDAETLDDLLDDELIYVHLSGAVEGKAAVLAARHKTRYSAITRRDLSVRVSGDLGVITGGMVFEAELPAVSKFVRIDIFATQVAARRDGRWRFVVQQATSLAIEERPAPARPG